MSENYQTLTELCKNNEKYFSGDVTENGQRLCTSFSAIVDNLEKISPVVKDFKAIVHKYDFDEKTEANGYRSFLFVIELAISQGIKLNRKICFKRDSVLFRKAFFAKESEACAQLFASLLTCLNILNIVRENSEETSLFTFDHINSSEQTSLLSNVDKVNQYCFYGRCLGFQFCDSMRSVLSFISLSMAIFSEAYYSQGSIISKTTSLFKNSTKYFTDPEEKAKRLVNITRNADIEFCKAFWFLSEGELMKHLPSVVAESVSVSKVIHIPTEPLSLECNGKEIDIPIPNSYIGRKEIQVRLISCRRRSGMIGEGVDGLDPPSKGLFFHCHGGGFVAQSSRSHECYLRQWAKDLDVPILSVDYSLAPKAPYPRALEEVFYAYCWALKKCRLLGSTGENVVVGGDSAGANLLTSMTLKCIDSGVRLPNGVFIAYAPMSVSLQASPARLLCVLDPLLPFGFLLRCMKAYTYVDQSKINTDSEDMGSFEEITESDLDDLQAHKSPVSDSSETLTYASLSSPQKDEEVAQKTNGDTIDNNLVAEDVELDSGRKYVSEFLEKYALDSDTDTDLTRIPENSQNTENSSARQINYNRIVNFVSSLRGRFESLVPSLNTNPSGKDCYCLDSVNNGTLYEEMKFEIPRDPFISPFLAEDEVLKQMPAVRIVTVHMDPCLDDCVMFARKLKRLNVDVTLDVLSGLPHGFLNFNLVSKEAFEATKLCTDKILELLDLKNA